MSKNNDEEEKEKQVMNLQNLLESLQPQLKELQALPKVKELVSSLETTDPHFHRYAFVSQIKDTLDSELTPMIEHLLNDNDQQNSNELSLVTNISNDLMKTEQFQNIASSIVRNVQTAADTLSEHLNMRTFDFTEKRNRKSRSSKDYFNTSQSDCSTLDGMDYMFMPPDQYKSLAKDIGSSKPLELRLKTLSILQQVPQGDLVASEAWERTKDGIHKALNDENEEINAKALNLVSRLFVNGSSHVIKEYFLLLVENLKEHFLDSTSHMVSVSGGLDLGDRRNALLLRKFRLLNDIQRELPTTWLRYSEKYVEEMIEAVIDLLGVSAPKIHNTNIACMNPFHFLSMVDPQGMWFKKWAHGLYSRSYLISAVSKHVSFFKRPIKSCFEVCRILHCRNTEATSSTDNSIESLFNQNDILYIQLLHSINILTRLMQFKSGRQLFSFELNNGKFLNLGMVIVALVDIMKLHPVTCGNRIYHAGYLIVDGLQSLCKSDAQTINACFLSNNIYQSMIMAFRKDIPSLPLVMEVLAELASSNEGCSQILTQINIEGFEQKMSTVDIICSIYMEEQSNQLYASLLPYFLKFLQNVLKETGCVDQLLKYNLHTFIASLFHKQKEETAHLFDNCKQASASHNDLSPTTPLSGSGSGSARRSAESQAHKKSMKLEKQILRTLLCLTLTPKGFSFFMKSELIEECVLFLSQCLQEKARTPKNCFGYMMSKICSTMEGISALIKSGTIEELDFLLFKPKYIFSSLCHYFEFYFTLFLFHCVFFFFFNSRL